MAGPPATLELQSAWRASHSLHRLVRLDFNNVDVSGSIHGKVKSRGMQARGSNFVEKKSQLVNQLVRGEVWYHHLASALRTQEPLDLRDCYRNFRPIGSPVLSCRIVFVRNGYPRFGLRQILK